MRVLGDPGELSPLGVLGEQKYEKNLRKQNHHEVASPMRHRLRRIIESAVGAIAAARGEGRSPGRTQAGLQPPQRGAASAKP